MREKSQLSATGQFLQRMNSKQSKDENRKSKAGNHLQIYCYRMIDKRHVARDCATILADAAPLRSVMPRSQYKITFALS